MKVDERGLTRTSHNRDKLDGTAWEELDVSEGFVSRSRQITTFSRFTFSFKGGGMGMAAKEISRELKNCQETYEERARRHHQGSMLNSKVVDHRMI